MTLTLISTTDIHGYLDQGLADLPHLVQLLGADLLIDNGDFFIGSPYATFSHKDAGSSISPLVTIANKLGYTVMVPGNHDLDYGLEWLQGHVQALKANYVCANLFDAFGHRVFAPYSLHELRGQRVAVVGLLNQGCQYTLPLRHSMALRLQSPLEALDNILLQIGPVDYLIVAYHGGIVADPLRQDYWTYPNPEDQASEILARFPSINSLIIGHQHFQRAIQTGPRQGLVQPGWAGQTVGLQVFDDRGRLLTNQLFDCQAKTYPLNDRPDFEAWMATIPDLSKLLTALASHIPADGYALDIGHRTYQALLEDLSRPFSLGRFVLTNNEWTQFQKRQNPQSILLRSGSYCVGSRSDCPLRSCSADSHTDLVEVIASPHLLPAHRLRQPLIFPLFDFLVNTDRY